MEFASIISEYTIKPIGRLLGHQVGYVIHYGANLRNLKSKVEELKAFRQTIEKRIAEAERKGEEIQPDVNLWLTKVAEITADTDELLTDESQAKLKCLHGCCPNLTVRHRISRKSTKLVEVVEQYGKKEFPQVSCATVRKEVLDVTIRDHQDFQSRMSIVKKIMASLKETDIQRIGVFGIGGVGKTTLAREVYKQASEDKKLFDSVVILSDVKSNPDPEAIQKKIAEKLGMDILQTETPEGRASRLCGRIQGKKILIILDDVQEKIELEAMGVPRLPTCKVLLTCRIREVLLPHKMNANKVFQLDLLDKEETWSLFERKAGEVVKHNSLIRNLAFQVAERCGGLPLLVITVASILKDNENVHVWSNALRQLKGFDKEDSTENVYLTLEWSYDQLNNTELQQLFLLCGIMVRHNHVFVADLLKYGLGLGMFTNIETVEEAHDKLEVLLGRLKDFCLLMDSETEDNCRVGMHDLVCHVANRIARRGQQMLSKEYRGDLREWPDEGLLRKCTKFSLTLRGIHNFPELPLDCPEVELFHLEGENDDLVVIPSNFFSEMQKLKVLVLTDMYMSSLPLSLQCSKMLQTLCLDHCMLRDITLLGQLSSLETLSLKQSDVRELPKEIGQLTHLRLLDLSECSHLEVIPPTVLSSLVRLEDLKLRNSFNKWEMESAKSNASLSELKHLSQLSALEIRILNADILPANLFSHKLTRYNIYIGDVWQKPMGEAALKTLKLKLTINNIMELDEGFRSLMKRTEDLSLDEGAVNIFQQLDPKDFENLKHLRLQNNIDSTYILHKKVECPNLVTLKVHGCDKLRCLFSFSMARSLVRLKQLKISTCQLLQEIVSARECDEENMDDMFPKLKLLKLEELPNLTRFCTGNYIEFPALEKLGIDDCFKLVEFIGDKFGMSSKDTKTCKEIEQGVLYEEEHVQSKNILFDEKVGFPRLMRLSIIGVEEVKAIWHVQLARYSFIRLKQVDVERCDGLSSLFPSSLLGRLTALETLKIHECGSLEVIFELPERSDVEEIHVDTSNPHDQLKAFDIQNLDSVDIYGCQSLKQIFPASVARGLQNLTQLSVFHCNAIEEIVGEEEEKEDLETTPPHFLFPKVTQVELLTLPQLTSFYPKPHCSQWPLLIDLKVRCDKVRTFAAEFSISQEKHEMNHLISQSTLFSINQDSFLNLENLVLSDMEIWNGPPQAIHLFFHKLKSITFQGVKLAPFSEQASFFFLQRLQNLEKIEVCSSSCKEIFVKEGFSSNSGPAEELQDDNEDAVGKGALPHVRKLSLFEITQLMHLGNADDSWSIVLPNLEILEVRWCPMLKSIESSAISFRNITSLGVWDCDGLEYLTSYSVAKSLVQLKTLKVEWCRSIVVIVSGNGNDAAGGERNEISFSRLQHLELINLRSLRRFCSGNLTVKFPSSMSLKVERCPALKLKNSRDDQTPPPGACLPSVLGVTASPLVLGGRMKPQLEPRHAVEKTVAAQGNGAEAASSMRGERRKLQHKPRRAIGSTTSQGTGPASITESPTSGVSKANAPAAHQSESLQLGINSLVFNLGTTSPMRGQRRKLQHKPRRAIGSTIAQGTGPASITESTASGVSKVNAPTANQSESLQLGISSLVFNLGMASPMQGQRRKLPHKPRRAFGSTIAQGTGPASITESPSSGVSKVNAPAAHQSIILDVGYCNEFNFLQATMESIGIPTRCILHFGRLRLQNLIHLETTMTLKF